LPQSDPVKTAFRGFLLDIALNAIFPLVLYRLSKRYISPSEFTALAVATTFPLGKSIFDIVKHRKLDPISVIVLLGIGASAIAVVFGGSPRLLLMRESLFTAVFGLACFVSLTLVTIVWTFRYAKRARERALPKVDALMETLTEPRA